MFSKSDKEKIRGSLNQIGLYCIYHSQAVGGGLVLGNTESAHRDAVMDLAFWN